MFGWSKPKKSSAEILREAITFNAEKIRESEGKSSDESLYIAICLFVDDLTARKNQKGYQELMRLIQSDYPQQFNDVITYVGWSTGVLKFKPEAEAAMRARHLVGQK